jgi:hypothetical protein
MLAAAARREDRHHGAHGGDVGVTSLHHVVALPVDVLLDDACVVTALRTAEQGAQSACSAATAMLLTLCILERTTQCAGHCLRIPAYIQRHRIHARH